MLNVAELGHRFAKWWLLTQSMPKLSKITNPNMFRPGKAWPGPESRRGSPACITPKGNCATSPVDAPKAIQPTTDRATGEHGAVQPGPPRCTWNAATNTASQHLCEGLGALLPRHGHPVLPVGRRPRTKLSGDFNSSSGVPPESYTSVQPRGGGTREGNARGDPPQGGVERPDTSRFATFSTPTCRPESSPS